MQKGTGLNLGLRYVPESTAQGIRRLPEHQQAQIQEIRLREEQPLAVKKEGKEELFTHRVTKEAAGAASGVSENCLRRFLVQLSARAIPGLCHGRRRQPDRVLRQWGDPGRGSGNHPVCEQFEYPDCKTGAWLRTGSL